ncbi:MAG: bacterial Ig-like domain-containing protein, partial [Gudongella sp.]|nr:bacterial Ig-like domain-containing protein [Gudongella sp.]
IEGTIGSLEVAGDNIIAYAVNAVITNANVSGENSKIVTEENTVVEEEEKKPSQGGGGGPSTPAIAVSAISVTTPPTKTEYEIGEAIDLAGLVVTATYSDSSSKAVTITSDMISGFDNSAAKVNQVVTVTYEGKTATFNVTIKEATLVDKNIKSVGTIVDINVANGTELESVGLPTTIEVTLDDNSTQNLEISWDGGNPTYNKETPGEYVFTGTLTLPANVTNTSNLAATVKVRVAEAVVEKYTVTFSVVGDNGSISAKANDVGIKSGDQVEKGSDLVFTATPDTGYEIKQWKYNDTVYGGTEKDFEHTNLWQDFNVTVEFEAIAETFTVTFMSGGANGDMDPVKVIEGQKYKLPENGFTAFQHKKFDHWKVENSDTKYYPGNKVEITGDTTFWANWITMPIEILDAPAKVLPGQKYSIVIYMNGEYQDGTKIAQKVVFDITGANSSGTSISTDGYLNVAIDETAEQFILKAVKKDDGDVFDEVTIKVVPSNALTIKKDDESIDKLSTDGYKWDKDSKTLTIQGLTINGNGQGIVFDGFDGFINDDTITLELVGTNKIDIEAGDLTQVKGIGYSDSSPYLTIKGTGSLEITMPDLGDKDTSSYGIRMYSLTVEDSASLIITNVKAKDSRGIYTSDYTIFRDNAKVEVESYGWVIDARGTSPGISIEGKAEFKGIAQGVGSILYTTGEIIIEKGTKVELIRTNLPIGNGEPKFFGYNKATLNIAEGLKLQGSENVDGSNLETAELTDDNPEKVVRDKNADPVEDVFKYVLIKAGEDTKSVTVGDMQGGPVYAKVQVNDGRYNVTTTGIENGKSATVKWYKNASKSETTSAPIGISIGPGGGVTVKDNKIELKVTVQNAASTVQGNYYFTVTIDEVESDVKTFTIETINLIETVSIAGLSVPIVGEKPYGKESLSVPQEDGYEISNVHWYDNNEETSDIDEFQSAHKYQIHITLKLKDGYRFKSPKSYDLNNLDENIIENVYWGAVRDAQLVVVFKELQ